MKERLSFSAVIIAIMFFASAWKETPQLIIYEGPDYRCEYEMSGKMYNGKYNSWYNNGKKRAEGSFLNNMRYGLWTVYDSTGRKRMQRKYRNNFEYELIFPAPSSEGPIPLLREPMYKLTYANGYIPYFNLQERAVVVSKRVWRYIAADGEHPLFVNDNFYHALIDSLIEGRIKAYDGPTDDEFRNEITAEARARLLDTGKYNVIGYVLKEDWFFDKDRMLSESRPIGIMPVFRNKNTAADSFSIAWFPFSHVRPVLAAQKVSTGKHPDYIRTLDDVLFFRYFNGPVYKESRYYSRTLTEGKENKLGPVLIIEQRRIEMSLIEMEHDIWIQYSK